MPKFKKCPRCEINYILEDQEYCEICQQELKGISLAEDNDDDVETEICPRCRINFLCEGETICESCAAERELEKEKSIIDDVEPDWKVPEEEAVEDEDLVDDEIDLSLDELAEGDEGEDEEEEPIEEEEFFVDIPDELLEDDEELEEEDDESEEV